VRIFVARLSDEIVRFAMKRHELFEDDVLTIRTPRGPVLVGDQMYIPVQPKASATSILEKLGFTGRVAQQFPEELLRFEGLEEEPNIPLPAAAPGEEAPLSPPLPASWTEKGMQIPTPAPGLADAKRLAFAAGTGRDIEEWEKYIKLRRAKMALPGDVDRPFQWSVQDFYLIATMTMSNVLFVGADGRIKRWISPSGVKTAQPLYIIFWGPEQLLVTRGANIYRFSTKDLPTELLNQLDAASPMSEEEARGTLTMIEDDAVAVTLEDGGADDAEEEEAGGESKIPEEAAPALVAVPAAQEEEAAPALVAVPAAQEEEAAPALVAVPAAQEEEAAPALVAVPAAQEEEAVQEEEEA
jgi:hypothetical protein